MPKAKKRESLEEALREHTELRAQVEDMRDFLGRPRPEIGEQGYHTWATDLSSRLVSLHDLLFRHFRNEEETGLLEELEHQHPRASGKIAALGGEHGEILDEIREVMTASLGYSAGKEPPDPRLRQRVTQILDQAEQHEQAETELIQDLLYSDLGEAG